MSSNSSWASALKIGEDAEKEFVEFLEKNGWSAGLNTATHLNEKRFYDIWVQESAPAKAKKKKPRPVITIEIKYDKRVKETGNVYFEHETLNNSRADYIVYKLDSTRKFYIAERDVVLNMINLPQFKQVKGGDTKTTGTLVTEELFKGIFTDCEKVFAQVS